MCFGLLKKARRQYLRQVGNQLDNQKFL